MAKKPDPSDALRRLLAEPGSLDDVWDDLLGSAIDNPRERLVRALAGLKKYDDRSAVLVFGAMLDQHLEQAISAVLHSTPKRTRKLFAYNDKEGGGILSTFAAKIKMGNSLGLYGEEMLEDLELIKLIRNVFAHASVQVDFDHSAVQEGCEAIVLSSNLNKNGLQVGHRVKAYDVKMSTARQKFSGAISMMAHYLGLFPHLELSDPVIPANYYRMYGKPVPLLQKSSQHGNGQ